MTTAAQFADARRQAGQEGRLGSQGPRLRVDSRPGVTVGMLTGSKLAGAAVAATSRTTGEAHASRERARAISRVEALKQAGWELVDETDYPARKGGYTEWTLRRHR